MISDRVRWVWFSDRSAQPQTARRGRAGTLWFSRYPGSAVETPSTKYRDLCWRGVTGCATAFCYSKSACLSRTVPAAATKHPPPSNADEGGNAATGTLLADLDGVSARPSHHCSSTSEWIITIDSAVLTMYVPMRTCRTWCYRRTMFTSQTLLHVGVQVDVLRWTASLLASTSQLPRTAVLSHCCLIFLRSG